ncbi:methylated-DNA--[protein]-cysteine S-methyltransferase [Stenotrophomonas maltophilia]|uniref:methylated-DNA--[protein]-cysteine S-methyltransferase n=1 Tax=Stenotrophomonas maltophilia TaxID=40324 RepID=UPI001075F400|nr:methylated-DNA--[protein]-cysteine S-methyltransferase [Stenotrophomonas maltophilia]TFZ44665.1 methylated-DNA--[protein]-cysteine S-methyltransferase [Stenotrophomonas maltophilia]
MTIHSNLTFKYHFRAPGSRVEGPIRFAIGQAMLGRVLIGRSQLGVCAIFLGEDAPSLRDQLAAAFAPVELQADQVGLQRELGQVIGFIDKDASEGVINLDIGGTEFEQKVWQALCGIPAGRTRSYSEVARDIGVPEAVRAVAGACAANVLAVAVPCHRVVRSDGSISGYRWGVERRRALLAEEAGAAMMGPAA